MLLPELAPDPLPPEAAEWRKAFGTLRPTSPPCRYVSANAWANIHEACADFIERFGAEAVRLGWTAPELFGVHPVHGLLRNELAAAVMRALLSFARGRGLDEATRSCDSRSDHNFALKKHACRSFLFSPEG